MTGRESLGVEAVKWIAFALMVLDHVTIFVTVDRPAWAFLLGRLVFPLFAMSVAHGLREAGEYTLDSVCKRLLTWALVAQVPYHYLVGGAYLNVLFTFWSALFLVTAFKYGRWNVSRGVLVGLAIVSIGFVEFGAIGIGVIASAFYAFRLEEGRPRKIAWAMFWVFITLLHAVNGVPVAMLAPFVWWAVVRWCEVPRVRHVFYWLYPAQWVAVGVLRWAF